MRSLLTLTAAFIALVLYLEMMDKPAPQPIAAHSKIIRTAPKVAVKHEPVQVIADKKSPLNLRLPTFANLKTQYVDSKNSVLDLFKKEEKPSISYNAELVFDAEKGESITGGKVNITIPFG
ncbi:hypothetical protein [Oceanicoccus sp. KOV_DT_Chl]|uniref:hypothetical protein n=1 Tax=Oceanicoccus sp. KOV_DT_Chl TaxID=1904639 RepID=UPI000C7A7E58|nr:hypothetical protein [Oceanicoccus sp. KOV_DT_Chl]